MSESNNFLIDQLIGEKIRMYRKIKGYSLAWLSGKIGVSPQQLQKYETGQNRVSVAKILQIAEALQISVGRLVHLDREYDIISQDTKLQRLVRNYNLIESENLRNLLVYSSKVLVDNQV